MGQNTVRRLPGEEEAINDSISNVKGHLEPLALFSLKELGRDLVSYFNRISVTGTSLEVVGIRLFRTHGYVALKCTLENGYKETRLLQITIKKRVASYVCHVFEEGYFNHFDCPDSILSLLSPPDTEVIGEWRENCRERNMRYDEARRAWRRLKPGDIIEVHGYRYMLISKRGQIWSQEVDWDAPFRCAFIRPHCKLHKTEVVGKRSICPLVKQQFGLRTIPRR